ncbi:hypothetical protein C5167_008392 [Papaver somniferum]|uniref:Uncharacterized protein n=1 Tax=Papaver somniferum TaxID=3469 RepID=A0A4Y7JXB9_PAPSO|nr:hypothetical protein C5167_008392 [Papaver somniferum]
MTDSLFHLHHHLDLSNRKVSFFNSFSIFSSYGRSIEKEKPLAKIKPDEVSGNYAETIKKMILESNFSILREMTDQLDEDIAGLFYADHSKYMTRLLSNEDLTAPALALLLVFRTEASYSSFEEGRKACTKVIAGTNFVKDLQHLLDEDDLDVIFGAPHRPCCMNKKSLLAHSHCTKLWPVGGDRGFFEHVSAEQRKQLPKQVVGHIFPLSLQMYGCRVIQKALEVIKLDQKTQLFGMFAFYRKMLNLCPSWGLVLTAFRYHGLVFFLVFDLLPYGLGTKVNEEGIPYYNNIINALLDKGLQPYLTLYYWDLPNHLQESLGGWFSDKIVQV